MNTPTLSCNKNIVHAHAKNSYDVKSARPAHCSKERQQISQHNTNEKPDFQLLQLVQSFL